MNPIQQRFMIFCVFVALIIGGVALIIGKTLTNEPGKVDLNGKSANIQSAQKAITLTERLGVDDNASIAFMYGADMQGCCGWNDYSVILRIWFILKFAELGSLFR